MLLQSLQLLGRLIDHRHQIQNLLSLASLSRIILLILASSLKPIRHLVLLIALPLHPSFKLLGIIDKTAFIFSLLKPHVNKMQQFLDNIGRGTDNGLDVLLTERETKLAEDLGVEGLPILDFAVGGVGWRVVMEFD